MVIVRRVSSPTGSRRDLRAALFDAAKDALADSGFAGLRNWGAIPALVGVQPQTGYNSSGDTAGLVQALVLDHTAALLDGIDAALRRAHDVAEAVRPPSCFFSFWKRRRRPVHEDRPHRRALGGDPAAAHHPGEPGARLRPRLITVHLRAQWGLADADLARRTALPGSS